MSETQAQYNANTPRKPRDAKRGQSVYPIFYVVEGVPRLHVIRSSESVAIKYVEAMNNPKPKHGYYIWEGWDIT